MRRRHLIVDGYVTNENYRSRHLGRSRAVPPQNRTEHGQSLFSQYAELIAEFDERRIQIENPITEEVGIYVEVIGVPGVNLRLDSLDTSRDFKLRHCRRDGDHEVGLIFIPETRRHTFQRKLEEYLEPEKDSRSGPRNHSLIDSIAEIRLANLKSFWTDDANSFPQDIDQYIWWELWLKKRSNDENLFDIAQQLADRINGQLGNTSLSFFDSVVVLIKASARQLEIAPELIACLEELRRAKETPTVFIESSPKEQQEWANNLMARISFDENSKTAVAILDTGVNYHHQLLAISSNQNLAECWNPQWSKYDIYTPGNQRAPYNDHGSRQAGLALYGDLRNALLGNNPFIVAHHIESGRILPPVGTNAPELYGAITIGTALKLEIMRPDWNRVYSLAITADSDRDGGLPSSWSAEIDQFSFGLEDGKQRLVVISAGNNRNISADSDYWDQLQLAEIEDPAQSWNALTVGAYTELSTNDDPNLNGWSPLAQAGDVAPASRSSVNWHWRKHAPIKPDIVEEGGNRLLSPNQDQVSNEDVVSLLTTSGRTTGQIFEVTGDTSAACALVSRHAAVLMAEYPEYWPETIRGLLVHSSEWTDRMWERFGLLCHQHSPKVASETMLRCVGFGVPNLDRARYSANHALTLIAQETLQPFIKDDAARGSTDPKLNEMQLYQLPWPVEVLQQLPPELEVKLRVTLSYFIEPNPGRRGYRQRYSYQSHGLRFEVIRPGQSLDNFRSFINGLADSEDYDGPEGDNDGWQFGARLRTRGSLHSDTWTGNAAALADMHTIAVYPVGGWWKYRTGNNRWQQNVKYSIMVSIDVPDESVDIYTEISNIINLETAVIV